MQLRFDAITEAQASRQWQALFKQRWPAYRTWFLARGGAMRPTLDTAVRNLRRYMPELEPTFDRLVDLAGGDETAARFLSGYRPPPYLISCSQAALQSADGPVLLRNYDLDPSLNDGLILHTAWNDRRVMASSEFLWGVADGMNENGLALSLAFGGRKAVGKGFGIPIILRYILEFCERTKDAVEVLRHVPSHMAYNITLLDRTGKLATVHVGPDRPVQVTRTPLATNHQGTVVWPEHSRFTHTLERERVLRQHVSDKKLTPPALLAAFLRPPLYSSNYRQGFGTLYTTLYRPTAGTAEWHWPDAAWRQSFEHFQAGSKTVRYTRSGAKALTPPTPTTAGITGHPAVLSANRISGTQADDFSLIWNMRQSRYNLPQGLPEQQRPFLAQLLDQLGSESPGWNRSDKGNLIL